MTHADQENPPSRAEGARRSPREAVESSFALAVRLTAPAAIGALTAALIAIDHASVLRLTLGVAAGALVGAATSAFFGGGRKTEPAAPPAPQNRIEQIGEAALEAAAHLAGPAANLSEAVSDALRILERLPVALLLLDEKGRIVFANSLAKAELGGTARGEHFSSALRAPALAEAIREAYSGQAFAEVEFTQRRYQERLLHATVRTLTKTAEEGSAPHASNFDMLGHARIAVLLQDRTRIRRTEQLHRDFVANASHELKTPIAAIAGFVETLRGAAKDDPEAQERFLRIMQQQAERMRRLVEDLLSLNRIELNEHVPPRDAVDLPRLVRSAAAQSPEFEMGRIEVMFDGYDGPRSVRGDPGQLEQVFINLIENGLKYGGDETPIHITIAERGAPRRQIGVSIEDFGPGISREHIRRLTERFYRVENQKGGLKSGTGLGLSIVKHAVSRHRGELEIESRLGHGSRFTVWLPPIEDFDAAPVGD